MSTTFPEHHGSPYNRGRADSYYYRLPEPHYYDKTTLPQVRVTTLTADELEAYHAGFDENDDFKDWN